MKAVVWHGKEDVRVDEVPDPAIQEPTDAIVRITTTGLCGSDLHTSTANWDRWGGDIIGHEPMGIVEEVGSEVTHIAPGDRVVRRNLGTSSHSRWEDLDGTGRQQVTAGRR